MKDGLKRKIQRYGGYIKSKWLHNVQPLVIGCDRFCA